MSDRQLFDDEVIERVRELAPVVPAEVMSSSGPSAQRVLDRVLVTAAPADTADIARAPVGTTNARPRRPAWSTRRPAWLTRRQVGALTGVMTAAVVIVAVLVIPGGGGPSIVGRAYGATDPVGVIVHYVETTRSSNGGPPEVTEYWLDGPDSRRVFNANRPQSRQDIVVGGGLVRNLTRGRLAVLPVTPPSTPCATELVLNGGCSEQQNDTPVDGLRSLYRSGHIRADGHATINGRHVDVLSGSTRDLRVRALVDAHTFLPVKVTITETLPGGNAKTAVTETLTITDYQRLPVTPRNRKLLALPAHPNVPVIRFRTCPTTTNSHKLCRSSPR